MTLKLKICLFLVAVWLVVGFALFLSNPSPTEADELFRIHQTYGTRFEIERREEECQTGY